MKKLFALCLLPLCLLLCACEADAPQQEEAQAELLIGFSQLGSESSGALATPSAYRRRHRSTAST